MDERTITTLDLAAAAGVSEEAVACYARWWQLETYMREVAYTELRSRFGKSWPEVLGKQAVRRAEGDTLNEYMASADADDLLTYADASVLFDLVQAHWDLFGPVLPPKLRWLGQADTLQAIRNRVAHCRRPHVDDLGRIEIALRDLESGARRFYGSYTDTNWLSRGGADPLELAWVDHDHPVAARLVDHCEQSYNVRFRLGFSTRPWSLPPASSSAISGREGVVWHAHWIAGGRDVNPSGIWRELSAETREVILHLLFWPGGVTASFPAVEDPGLLADAIGDVFDRLMENSREPPSGQTMKQAEHFFNLMKDHASQLPAKVQYQSPLCLFDSRRPDAFDLFGA